MKAVRALAFAVVVALVVPVVAEDKKDAKFDAEKVVGEWTITGGKKAGKDIDDNAKKGTYSISKDKITLKEDGKTMFVFAYTVDAKETPAAIDMEIAESAIDGLKGSKAKGIIELSGDELKLAYDGSGGERPKKFDDEKAFSFVLKKKADKEEKKDK